MQPPPTEFDFGAFTSICGGRMIFGPHWGVFTAANFLILIPGLLMTFYTAYNTALSITIVIMMVLGLAALWKCASTDPGIIPKQPPPPPPEEKLSEDGARMIIPPVDRNKTVQMAITLGDGSTKEISVDRKWCYTCNILRPARAAHCPFCDVCISRRDHHCPWTGTCIGERNYRYFFLFVNITSILALAVISGSCFGLNRRQRARMDADSEKPGMDAFWEGASETNYLEFILVIYGVIILLMVGGLAIYHWYLVIKNFTTHEEIRLAQTYDADTDSPFDVGCVANVHQGLCAPTPPSSVTDKELQRAREQGGGAHHSQVGNALIGRGSYVPRQSVPTTASGLGPTQHQTSAGASTHNANISPDKKQLVGNESDQFSDEGNSVVREEAPPSTTYNDDDSTVEMQPLE